MKKLSRILLLACMLCSALPSMMNAQNPIIRDQFSADPTARVFNGQVWLFPSHDIISPVEPERRWFCMGDYHVFSSSDLSQWTDHGVILDQKNVPWGRKDGFSMWAPDCIEHNGKYCFFFPDAPDGALRGFAIGVATADNPEGPYTAMEKPIGNPFPPTGNMRFPMEGPSVVFGIDPCVLKASDGNIYLYWAGMGLRGAKLNDSLTELASESVQLDTTLPEGFKEGPFVFERNGVFYLTYPWVRKNTEVLAYATSDNPLGPFTHRGIIMAESPTGCWTNHHSLVEYEGQWYLFYHHNDYSPTFDKNRSVCADSLFFEADGSIREVKPTLRGVGLTPATAPIQMDRYYSAKGEVEVCLHDSINTFEGWYLRCKSAGSGNVYTNVKFDAPMRKIVVRYRTDERSRVMVGTRSHTRRVTLRKTKGEWKTVTRRFRQGEGVEDIVLELSKGSADIDWVAFK